MSRKPIDLAGQHFGRLVCLARTGEARWSNLVWSCRCDCGLTCERTTSYLRQTAAPCCPACARRGSRGKAERPERVRSILAELAAGCDRNGIAERHGVSRQRVAQLAAEGKR